MNKGNLTKDDIGKEFFSYYLQLTKRGNRYLKNTGIFKVRLKYKVGCNFEFEILETTYKNTSDLQYIINAYHAQSANNVFTTREEAEKAYDKEIMEDSKCVKSSEDRLVMLSLLSRQKTKEELAGEWYKNLTEEQKEYVAIINLKTL